MLKKNVNENLEFIFGMVENYKKKKKMLVNITRHNVSASLWGYSETSSYTTGNDFSHKIWKGYKWKLGRF